MGSVCSIEGCTTEYGGSRGFCGKHYMRWLKHGDPNIVLPTGFAKATGTCAVDGCDTQIRSRGFCEKHYQRWQKYGDPTVVRRGGFKQESTVTYKGLHTRLLRKRGKAQSLGCVGCGDVASHWAYDHSDPSPLLAENGCLYSLDLDRYQPMCVACHRVFDLEHRAA